MAREGNRRGGPFEMRCVPIARPDGHPLVPRSCSAERHGDPLHQGQAPFQRERPGPLPVHVSGVRRPEMMKARMILGLVVLVLLLCVWAVVIDEKCSRNLDYNDI